MSGGPEGAELRVKRAADWEFPLPPFLAQAVDAFADAVESEGATIPGHLDIGDYLMDIDSASRDLSDPDQERAIRDYYL